MVVLITDNKLFGGGNSCQHVHDSWWVIRFLFLEGWPNSPSHENHTRSVTDRPFSLGTENGALVFSRDCNAQHIVIVSTPLMIKYEILQTFSSHKKFLSKTPWFLFLKLALFVAKEKLVHLHQLSSKVSVHRSTLSCNFADSLYAST